MSVTCPDGHTSESTDYCDVCGAPIGGSGGGSLGGSASAGGSAASAGSAAVPSPSTCPHCGSPAASGALFCENCGYDFTTGATPVAHAPSSLDLGATGAVPAVTAPPTGAAADPSGTGGPAPDPLEPPPAVVAPPAASSAPSADPAAPVTPPPPGDDAWVAELWVDPDWYAAQQAEDPMPSVGLPVLIPLRERSVLVGRPSASRNIRPQVDAGADSGVSRRHCQLNTDGHRWWVEDLQSSNGTFVARVGEPLPDDPIRPGQRHELQDGDRLYLGSWTRLVVRKALPGEV